MTKTCQFKTFVFTIILLLILFSCSKDDSNKTLEREEVFNKSLTERSGNQELNSKDFTFLANQFKSGMISFTQRVSVYHSIGITYQEFKNSIDPNNGLNQISEVGDQILYEAYNYLENQTPAVEYSGKYMKDGLIFILNKNSDLGKQRISEIDLSKSSQLLFGVSDEFIEKVNHSSDDDGPNYNDCGSFFGDFWCHLGNA